MAISPWARWPKFRDSFPRALHRQKTEESGGEAKKLLMRLEFRGQCVFQEEPKAGDLE